MKWIFTHCFCTVITLYKTLSENGRLTFRPTQGQTGALSRSLFGGLPPKPNGGILVDMTSNPILSSINFQFMLFEQQFQVYTSLAWSLSDTSPASSTAVSLWIFCSPIWPSALCSFLTDDSVGSASKSASAYIDTIAQSNSHIQAKRGDICALLGIPDIWFLFFVCWDLHICLCSILLFIHFFIRLHRINVSRIFIILFIIGLLSILLSWMICLGLLHLLCCLFSIILSILFIYSWSFLINIKWIFLYKGQRKRNDRRADTAINRSDDVNRMT